MRSLCAPALIAVALLATPADLPALSTHAYVGVFQDEAASHCEFTQLQSTAYVVVTNAIPMTSITFQAGIPPGIGTYIYESSSFSTTGNSQTGVTVNLGGCTASPVTLMSILYTGGPLPPDCVYWPAHGVGGDQWSQFTFVDCDGVTRGGQTAVFQNSETQACCETAEGYLAPYHPWPPDGATDVPRDLTMTWELPDERGYVWLQLGTEPPPPLSAPPGDYGYWDSYTPPEPLEPNTTYYWVVSLLQDYYHGVRSDTWSFTTGETTVPVEVTTWGSVKALYR